MGWSHTHMWWLKIRRDISAVESPTEEPGVQPCTKRLTQSSSTRKRNPHNTWLEKPAGIVTEWGRESLESQEFLLQGLCQDLLTEIQCWDSSLKGTSYIQNILGWTEFSGIRAKAGGATLCQIEVLADAIFPFLSPPPTELAGRCHI